MKYFILVIAVFLNIHASESKGATPPPSLVQTVVAKEGIINSLQNYVGTLYYDRHSNLASESSGVVSSLYVKEGQRVKKGESLLKLESSILQAKVSAKKASLNSLISEQTKQKKDLERSDALLKRNSISQSSYDTTFYTLEALDSQIASVRAELLSMKLELKKKTIKAPFDAIVVKRDIDIGEWVAVGSSVFSVVDPKSIEARVNIPSKLLSTISKNQKLQAKIGTDNLEVNIKTIVPLADKTSRTFPIKLSLNSKNNFIEGMRIDIQIPTLKKEKAILVPRDAVIKRFGNFVVFSVVEGKAVMIPVSVLSYTNNEAAVKAQGLQANMKVIVKGNERVFPNMPVIEKTK